MGVVVVKTNLFDLNSPLVRVLLLLLLLSRKSFSKIFEKYISKILSAWQSAQVIYNAGTCLYPHIRHYSTGE